MIASDYIPIRQAAKAVRRSRQFVRGLIEAGEVPAIVAGGRPEAPRLRVSLVQLQAAISRLSAYVPKQAKARRAPQPKNLHEWTQNWVR